MIHYKFFRLFLLLFPFFLSHATVDFNRSHDFILESKQIIIPHHPTAFNPSIIRYKGRLLMSFREMIYPTYYSWVGLVWLDENFQPEGRPQYLNSMLSAYGCEDARLLMVDDRLYMVYNGSEELALHVQEGSSGFSRMYVAQLREREGIFDVVSDEPLNHFEGQSPVRREKNWVPFEYHKNLLLAYSIFPHLVLKPVFGTESCETFDIARGDVHWRWGELRGGTPALLDKQDDQYIAFFHSSIYMKSPFSDNKSVPHYFVGAYTFSKESPFYVTQISPSPIINEKFYGPNPYQPYWHPVNVIFPCGILMDKHHVWMTYGKHDHEMWVVKMNKKKLLKSLVPVNPIP